MKSSPMRLVSAADYFDALEAQLPHAQQRIVLHAMNILWGPRTEVLYTLIKQAAERGVHVLIVGDYYSKFYANVPKLTRGDRPPKWAHTRALNYRLESVNAEISYVGKLGINPFKGRVHSKITIIDDVVYTFGGVNFTDGSFDNKDYMLEIRSAATADHLYDLVKQIQKGKPLPDVREALDAHNTLLFDGGNPGSSAIYETACDVVTDAQKVYFVSQMCPSGRLAKLIAGTENYCYFIRPTQTDPPANLALVFDKARYHITNHYRGKAYIHAKFILTENKDGSKHIISGSNNFSWRGIAFGTKEIAVHSTDPALWQAFYDYMQTII